MLPVESSYQDASALTQLQPPLGCSLVNVPLCLLRRFHLCRLLPLFRFHPDRRLFPMT